MKGFGPLFGMLADRIEALLADKGYDADAIREELAKASVEAVIPAKSNRRIPIPHDREKYRWRNLVERLFNKLKNWRRVATRYDRPQDPTSASSRSPQLRCGCPLSTRPRGSGWALPCLKPATTRRRRLTEAKGAPAS